MSKKTTNLHVVEITDLELGFINLCRRTVTGTISGIGIVRGQPTTYIGLTERIDASKTSDLNRLISGGLLPLTGNFHEDGSEEIAPLPSEE